MIYYKVYNRKSVLDSLKCKCGKCDQYKPYFHAKQLVFTPDKDYALKIRGEGNTNLLVVIEYSNSNFHGGKIIDRI